MRASSQLSDPPSSESRREGVRRAEWTVSRSFHLGLVLLGLQLVGMLAYSTLQYEQFSVTLDFAAYSQAWSSIAHGVLNPFSTLFGLPFWRNNSEFVLWPLSLLYWVYPHPVDLKWVQDLALVATELVALKWITEVVEQTRAERPAASPALVLVAVLAMVGDPWCYETAAFDFHVEPLAALFAVLVARALWLRRFRQLWWWGPLTLVTSALGGLYLAAVGVSGIMARQRRWPAALALVGAGLAWFAVLDGIGAVGMGGHVLATSYGYLAGSHSHRPTGLSDVVLGLVAHPGAALHMLASRWTIIVAFLAVVGFVGVASPWALPMVVVVILPSALNTSPVLFNLHASFQTWPALPFVLVGTVMVLSKLAMKGWSIRFSAALLAVWLGAVAGLAVAGIPSLSSYWLPFGSGAAGQLAAVQREIPASAEVIASQGVIGRFGARRWVYEFDRSGQNIPVHSAEIVFVITPGRGAPPEPSPLAAREALAFFQRQPGMRVMSARDGVYALAWNPPKGITDVTVP